MLYIAVHAHLVGSDTIPNLYFQRLPEKDSNADHGLVVAFVPEGGEEPERNQDGQVTYWNTGVTFLARAKDGFDLAAAAALDAVRDKMMELHGVATTLPTSTQISGDYADWPTDYGAPSEMRETILLVNPTTTESDELDAVQRPSSQLAMTIGHYPYQP